MTGEQTLGSKSGGEEGREEGSIIISTALSPIHSCICRDTS